MYNRGHLVRERPEPKIKRLKNSKKSEKSVAFRAKIEDNSHID